MGLFAGALLYYDRVHVILHDRWTVSEFIAWFARQGKLKELVGMIGDGVVSFYYYPFLTATFRKEGMLSIRNMPVKRALKYRVLDGLADLALDEVVPDGRLRNRLYQAILESAVKGETEAYQPALDNALKDFRDSERSALLVQSLLDEVYSLLGLRKPPTVRSQINEESGTLRMGWNLDFEEVDQALGTNVSFTPGVVLTAAARCNRLLWSAAELGCDLYLYSPMSTLVGDKLYESGERLVRTRAIVEQLESEVEFPDIRGLVNDDAIGLKEVLALRHKGVRFRKWLQDESDRDRNAIIAYHHEVAREVGWTRAGRRALGLFGVLSGAAAGATLGGAVAGVPGAITAAVVEAGLAYVFDVASKINDDWHPVVFGNWASGRIQRVLAHDLNRQSRPDRSERT